MGERDIFENVHFRANEECVSGKQLLYVYIYT